MFPAKPVLSFVNSTNYFVIIRSHTEIYERVGAHLFAIACQVSLDAGCDGFVAFTSKSDLVEYYKEKLNARVFRDRRMYIDEDAAQILLDKYMRK